MEEVDLADFQTEDLRVICMELVEVIGVCLRVKYNKFDILSSCARICLIAFYASTRFTLRSRVPRLQCSLAFQLYPYASCRVHIALLISWFLALRWFYEQIS